MRILLDTCTFLWLIADSQELSSNIIQLHQDPSNEVFLSPVSTWEIGLKYSLGKLHLPQEPRFYIPDQRKKHCIESLPLSEEATLYFSQLPKHHKDPFDKMLVCQALAEDLVIATADKEIKQYPAKFVW